MWVFTVSPAKKAGEEKGRRYCSDEYANRIPNPKHIPKYTKVKVLHTQDKHCLSWAAEQNYAATATAL